MNFVDRENELSSMLDSYSSKSSNLVVIYGRRRVGKTELVERFGSSMGSSFVYYLCDNIPLDEQVRRMSVLVGRAIDDSELVEMGAASMEAIFYRLARAKTKAKVVVVLDEFQRLAQLDKAIPSVFQRIWDLYIKGSGNAMLLLSGSSISMMHSEVLNYSAPLYGRSTSIFHLKPLGFKHAMQLTPKHASMTDRLYMYFIFGGIPAYYTSLADNINGYENADIKEIIRQILKEGSIFASEPNLLLSEEVRNDTVYMQVLELIANGIVKPGEIASKAGIAHGNLGKYIRLLESIGLVEKEMPALSNPLRKSKVGVYRIKDNFIDFYFRELKRHIRDANAVDSIAGDLDFIAQRKFEDLSRELIGDGVAGAYTSAGRWWGSDPGRNSSGNQEEIDAVAINKKSMDILFAECKWSSAKVGVDVYGELKRKAKLVQWRNQDRKEHYALFSKAGFTDGMKDAAKKEGIMLFDLDALEKALS